jgi:phosphatidylserine decarboxylase
MIKYYNRNTGDYETEKVVKQKYLNYIYSSPAAMPFLELVMKKKLFSSLVGGFCNTRLSKRKIPQFIRDFDIDETSFKKGTREFSSFNDFFIRELQENSRPVDMNADALISPCDGKILAYQNIKGDQLFQIKGFIYRLSHLIDDVNLMKRYEGGTCIILRLCPTDYHRFHFIDSGICSKTTAIKGDYYSVSPIALNKIPEVFCRNKREWSILKSDNFGDVLNIEVGATCVGTIVQTYTHDSKVSKGEEKGYFKFGGSTVILIFGKDKIALDQDILEQTKLGYETSVLMGEKIGNSK